MHFKSYLTCSIFLPVLGGIAGCISPFGPAYVQSTESSAAQVTFISESGGINIGVISLAGPMQGCLCSSTPPEIIGIIHNMALLVQGSSNYADQGKDTDRVSAKVPSGKEFRFMIPSVQYQTDMMGPVWKTTTTYCMPHESFVPEAGALYEVIHNAKVNRCGFAVYKIAKDQRLPISTAKYPLCLHPHSATATDRFSRGIREKCEERGAEIKLR
jgi:hypothetical protein